MKRHAKKMIALMLTAVIAAMFCFSAAGEETKTSARYNVVFVVDASGSMLYTDPEELRFDAVRLFLGLLANKGNRVGSVVFNTKIVEKTEITDISSINEKKLIASDIESCGAKDDTDIGAALKIAVEMITSQSHNSNDSVIILLSDGKTDLPKKNDYDKSIRSKAGALNAAYQNDIRIFTIGLNSRGGADMDELRQIALATGGECVEVQDARNLKDIFEEFYNLIYSTSTTKLREGAISADGKLQQSFPVPNAGVEEVNIIISSNSPLKNVRLTMPDGQTMSPKEVEALTMTAKTLSIIKLTGPQGGEWMLNADGNTGSKVKIEMIYNDNLSILAEYDDTITYHVGDTLTVTGYLYNNGQKADTGYEDYDAVLNLGYSNSSNLEEKEESAITMDVSGASYKTDVPLDRDGTYSLYMSVKGKGNGIVKTTKESPLIVPVGNDAPSASSDMDVRIVVWPFENSYEIDFNGSVTDTEDEKLFYKVTKSSFKDESYDLDSDNEILTIDNLYDLPEGYFTVSATDSLGAYDEFDIRVSMVYVTYITLIILGLLLLLFIIALIFFIRWLGRRKFMGTVTVTNSQTGQSDSFQKNRGKICLKSFNIGYVGIDGNAFFQATGKDYIYFVSMKKALRSSGDIRETKKIKINNRIETVIYAPGHNDNGITVVFESFSDPTF